jgi:lipopolysaccharide transport system permease protein
VILLVMMVWYRFLPGWQIVYLPVFVALAFLASLGPGLWITSLNLKYRDFRYIIPFCIQFGLYISPVGFSSSVIPAQWKLIYCLNPMVGVIEGFRWSLLAGDSPLDPVALSLGIFVTFFFLWLGVKSFRKMEKGFADFI